MGLNIGRLIIKCTIQVLSDPLALHHSIKLCATVDGGESIRLAGVLRTMQIEHKLFTGESSVHTNEEIRIVPT